MTLARALQVAAGNSQESADIAEAIDFDGTNDFLTRTGGLTGITDGKTFTLSFWLWAPNTPTQGQIICNTGSSPQRFAFYVSSNNVNMRGYDASGSILLQGSFFYGFAINTWNHILVSFDMANTDNRFIYINDVDQGGASFNAYVNGNIDFTNGDWRIGAIDASTALYKTRFSNVYFDRTYRNLSITANRRLFVTADLKPAADQAALNPILYLPMDDPTSPGANAGTGGDFTLTGTVARSGRGPNQYNAPYSTFDGGSDYLSRTTAPTGIANGKQFTWSFVTLSNSASTGHILTISTSTSYRVRVYASGSAVNFQFYNSAGTRILGFEIVSPDFVTGRNNVICISVDLSDTAKRHIFLNGVAYATTWSPYTNDDINFNVTTTPRYYIGAGNVPSLFYNGNLGALWFNTSYIDLSVADNLAKFVSGTGIDAKPVDLGATGELPTGTSPLIYLPMYGNDAGKNYGTGGDFTVNSGPYTGARGPNEYWGNLADFDGTTGYLSRTTALGLSDGKTFSISFWYAPDSSSAANYIYYTDTSGGSARVYVLRDASNNLNIVAKNSAGTNVLNATVTTGVFSSNATAKCIQICIDLTSTSLRKIYVDGVNQTSITWTTYTNDNINWNVQNTRISTASNGLNGKLSEFYFTTDYIDFTQEANRLKFRDAFGNPVNLTQQIEAAAIPNPAIYMRFPPTSFGTNSGTGGDFTVNGTITDGGQL